MASRDQVHPIAAQSRQDTDILTRQSSDVQRFLSSFSLQPPDEVPRGNRVTPHDAILQYAIRTPLDEPIESVEYAVGGGMLGAGQAALSAGANCEMGGGLGLGAREWAPRGGSHTSESWIADVSLSGDWYGVHGAYGMVHWTQEAPPLRHGAKRAHERVEDSELLPPARRKSKIETSALGTKPQGFVEIDWPVKFRGSAIFDRGSGPKVVMPQPWMAGALNRGRELGLDVSKISGMFEYLPLGMAKVLQEAFDAVEAITRLHVQRGATQMLKQESPEESDRRSAGAGLAAPSGASVFGSDSESDRLWDENLAAAMFRVSLNEDGKRESSYASHLFTQLTGIHHEEILARIAHRQILPPHSELEQLGNIVQDIIAGPQPVVTRYLRYISMDGTGKFVKQIRHQTLDGNGRVTAVHFIFLPISCIEFENARVHAIESGTNNVRPFMGDIGDDRDALTLLQESEADMERHKVKNLISTTDGRAMLERFADIARKKLLATLVIGRKARAELDASGKQHTGQWNCGVGGWPVITSPSTLQEEEVNLQNPNLE